MREVDSNSPARVNKSALFSAFNLCRHSGKFDRKRVNRALGYVQAQRVALLEDGTAIISGTSEPVYYVSRDGCDCPDHLWRGSTCKHMICRWLMLKVSTLTQAAPTDIVSVAPVPEPVPAAALEADVALLWG